MDPFRIVFLPFAQTISTNKNVVSRSFSLALSLLTSRAGFKRFSMGFSSLPDSEQPVIDSLTASYASKVLIGSYDARMQRIFLPSMEISVFSSQT